METSYKIVLPCIVGLLVFSVVSYARADRAAGGAVVPGQYIVVFEDSVENAGLVEEDLLARTRAQRLGSYRTAIKGFSARLSASDLKTVANDPRVAFVSEDREVSSAQLRGNAGARGRKPLPPPVVIPPQTLPTGVDRINAEGKTNTGAGVHVAVIDTGIALKHPDLAANIAGGKNCTTSNTSDYADQNGHGTHVAGTIAALNDSQGVVGVAPGAKLWAVRVLDRNGSGTWSSVICGLDFVASKSPATGGPISIANMSLGGVGVSDNNCGNTNKDALHKAVCRVRDAGVTLVVAAGNSGANASGFVPAAYDDAVITVSALADSDGTTGGLGAATSYGADDTFASFSNFGTAVDLGAPGTSIYSTVLSGGYGSMSGTSMAAPHVAGAAALYLATHPAATWSTVRDALVASGEAAGFGHTDPSGVHKEHVVRADAL